MYGLAFAYMELGDMEPAQKHFQAVQEMEAPSSLRGMARNELRKIAVREFKARGSRTDAATVYLMRRDNSTIYSSWDMDDRSSLCS